MTTASFKRLRGAVTAKLRACEANAEAWKFEHDEAMFVLSIEELVGDVNETYDNLTKLVQRIVESTISGRIPYDLDSEEELVSICDRWKRLAKEIDEELCRWAQTSGYDVSDVKQLRENLEKSNTPLSPINYHAYVSRVASEIHIDRDVVSRCSPSVPAWPE